MSTATFPCHEAGARFTCNDAVADAACIARIRDDFARRLRRRTGLDEARLCDVLLAVNEALANTAEFAYRDGGEGTLDLNAVRDPLRRTLTVTVSDRGRWRQTTALNRRRNRGRGIPLMRALADSLFIESSVLGTSVCMRFDEVRATLPTEVGAG